MEVIGKLECTIEHGWRVKLVDRLAPVLALLPAALAGRIIDWAVRGVKVGTFMR